MDSLTTAALLLNGSGTFTINKVEVYRNGKPTGQFKFQEVVTINSASEPTLTTLTKIFPKAIYKTKTNYKLTYVGLAAIKVIKKLLPLLTNPAKQKAAKILIKLHNHKHSSKAHAPKERYAFRNALREELTGAKEH